MVLLSVKRLWKIPLFMKRKEFVVVTGFTGVGLVGKITTDFLIEYSKKGARLHSIFISPYLPPVLINEGGSGRLPSIRTFVIPEEKRNIVVISCDEQPEHPYYSYLFSYDIIKIAREFNPTAIITVGGVVNNMLTSEPEDPKAYVIFGGEMSRRVLEKRIKELGVEVVRESHIGVVLLGAGLVCGLADFLGTPSACILIEVPPNQVGLYAALKASKILSSLFDISIDFDRMRAFVERQKKAMEERIKKEVEKYEEAKKKMEQLMKKKKGKYSYVY